MYTRDGNVLIQAIRKSKLRLTEAEEIFLEKVEEALTLPLGWIDKQSSKDLQALYRKSTGFSEKEQKQRF